MNTCPYCSHSNREGVFFCEECGHPFVGQQDVLATTKLVQEEQTGSYGRMTWGSARFEEGSSILVRIRDYPDAIRLDAQDEILLGRSDPKSDAIPTFDLAPFDGAEQGVSRRHAVIQRSEDTLTLTDLGSTNGTFLNGQRLVASQPRVVRDGDEIRIGRLVLHIFFE